jgi:hypothetical protein
MSKLQIELLDNVWNDNVDADGNLQAGLYNVSYNGIRSFAPMFKHFDGKTWEGQSEDAVYVRAADVDYREASTGSIMTVWVRTRD